MRPALTRTLASAALAAALLAACGQSPVIQLYQLRAEPPQSVPPAAAGAPVWQLLPMTWPGYLDREAVLRPAGQAALQSVPGARWAEPLRDAVPRLLLADLDRLRGSGTVFSGPLPPGLKAQQQLRVELSRLDAEADGRSVTLQGRWWLQDPNGGTPPLVHEVRLSAPVQGDGVDALVAAHRQVVFALAQAVSRGG